MPITTKSKFINLNNTHVNENYASVLTGTGKEYISDWFVTASIDNPAVDEFIPPPPDGLQYEADRQTQLRKYAATISHYTLGLYVRKNGSIYKRKTIPLYKYYPDHQVDLFFLFWSTAEGTLDENEELLLKFEGTTLPTNDDNIVSSIRYEIDDDALNESWFTVAVQANKESLIQLPDNTLGYTFKQLNGTEQLKWSYQSGIVEATSNYDLLEPNFEQTDINPGGLRTIYFTCTVNATVLLKTWSE